MPEQTLAIIKPDAFKNCNVGKIITAIEMQGLQIVSLIQKKLTTHEARCFYAVHDGKPFYEPLVEFMSSGPCIALVLEGENAVQRWRTLMGPTDPSKAPDGTIRRLFGTNVRLNAVHGSDSSENAKSEILFFFTADGTGNSGVSRKESSC